MARKREENVAGAAESLQLMKKDKEDLRHWNHHHHHRRRPIMLPFSFSIMILILLPAYFGIFGGVVEGNSEIESCVLSGSSVQKNNVGDNFGLSDAAAGASGSSNTDLFGGGGGSIGNPINNNNNNEASSSNVDPHSLVLCQIRTIHPDLNFENLTSSSSLLQLTRLRVKCNDVLFFESYLSPGQLRSFSELHDLTIEKCKLKNLPSDFLAGLRHLRRLTINTGNSDWAARSLEISPGALEDVPSLRHLNLGFNHMWSIPEGELCKLGSLQTLNLTRNLLNDIEDLGLPGRPALRSSVKNSQVYDFTASSSSSSDSSASSGGGEGSGPGLSGCLSELKSLDLSFNSLRTLGSRRIPFKRLQELRLNHNWLEELEDDALHGLDSLKVLNLSSNRLVALPTKLFHPTKLLRELDLRNNSLAALSPGLFGQNGLEHLQVLDLSMNALSSELINAEVFKHLVRLVILHISDNQLTHLSPIFGFDLISLQVLDLSHNLISSIAPGTFATMSNLHSLNLSKNRLTTINSNMFNGLYVLHKLIIDYNQISTIQPDAMKNLTSLQDLGMIGNDLKTVPVALRGLQNLRMLDLGDNKISSLHNDSFLGMTQLIGLRLVDNQLEEIPKGLCENMMRLRVFNAAQNKISKISSKSFSSCPDLKVLRLDTNQLSEIPVTLKEQLQSLLWFNISQNKLKSFDYRLLPPSVEWLDVSHNQLKSLGGAWLNINSPTSLPLLSGGINGNKNISGNGGILSSSSGGSSSNHHHHASHGYADHPNARLRVVDASNNLLSELDHNSIPPQIEVLRFSHNLLKRIAPDTFARVTNLRRVELIGNQLENVPLNALRLPRVKEGKPLPEFFLGGNPFLCDCEMEWLTRVSQITILKQYPRIVDIDAIICRPMFPRSSFTSVVDSKSQEYLCPYTSHCFAVCHCCLYDFCDCQQICPDNCTCYHDASWTSNVIECSNSNASTIPASIPMDSTEVYLDGNAIPILKSHSFIGRKNLQKLYLNGSHIEKISNKSFNGLLSLQTLHLEQNKLKVLHGYEFDHLSRLKELFLQDNVIISISNTTFLPLKSLEILRLDGNRLVVFTVWQLSLNPYLVEIGLARNQWNCDCQFLHQLYGWVTDNSRKVVDLVQLQCVWNTTHKPGPHLIDYNRTCGSSWALMGIENGFDFSSLSPLPLALAFVSFITLLILVVALVILCRENLSLWLFTRFNGFRLCNAGADFEDDKSYDAYLIYSQKDEEFVAQRIADELETNDNYRLCLHYRDLICETGDLKEMMIGAVENSKSVLIILSRNFLQGEWSSGEYRSAFHAVLKKSQKGTNIGGGGKLPPKKILIVFIEDIPKVEINPDIRSWVTQNKIQVIKWNIHSADYKKNRKFWRKLKFSIPDPSSHYHSNITSNTTTTSASSGESHGGIMTTLKYSTAMQNESQLHHIPTHHPHHQHPHQQHHHHHQTHPHHHPHHHQQIIVDESGRFITTTTTPSSATNTLNNSVKYWPYGATNFVALPPKYQTNGSSHHGSVGGNGSHPPSSMHSPGSPHHYHPPLPLSNPPKSPPSSQSTDSTTTTMADEAPSLLSQLTMASFNSGKNGSSSTSSSAATKSPLPVPKSSYSSRNTLVNNPINSASNSSNNSSSTSNNEVGGGESYLSEGEHLYATCLDPPSPQPTQQSMSLSQNILNKNNSVSSGGGGAPNFLNNIHLPNGYTYQSPTLNHHQHQQQQQWLGGGGSHHPHHHHLTSTSPNNGHQTGGKHGGGHQHHQVMSSFVGMGNGSSNLSNPISSNGGPNLSGASGGNKGFKQKVSDGNNPVQTYLV